MKELAQAFDDDNFLQFLWEYNPSLQVAVTWALLYRDYNPTIKVYESVRKHLYTAIVSTPTYKQRKGARDFDVDHLMILLGKDISFDRADIIMAVCSEMISPDGGRGYQKAINMIDSRIQVKANGYY